METLPWKLILDLYIFLNKSKTRKIESTYIDYYKYVRRESKFFPKCQIVPIISRSMRQTIGVLDIR
jgi:hypothetical protein